MCKVKAKRLLMLVLVPGLLGLQGIATAASPADCAAYADRVQRSTTSTMGGAARGALGGAAFGAIVGDSSKAAGRGAALGAVIGGVHQSSARNDTYNRAYDDCIAGRVSPY